MFRSLYTAASGMNAQQTNLDNVANNLSNANTVGFRKRRVQFEDMIYQNMVTPGAAATQQTVSAGLQIGLGTRAAATEILNSQGDFQQTGNSLDLAIQGMGYFQVMTPTGQIAYTRAGSFHLDSSGNIVTSDGDALQPSITIPADATAITIGADGTVSVTLPNQNQSQQIGQIQLATFPNPGGLNSVGSNLLLPTSSSGDAITGTAGGSEGLGTMVQGSLEQSNVNTVEEFIQMILAQRSYEANSQVAKAADQMFQEVNQLGK
ncbi:MAG: flagellar basal-body rod protein FlgG [Candidatus Korobacteraceae bacterium]